MPDTRQFVADRQQLALRRQQLALLERHARITVVLCLLKLGLPPPLALTVALQSRPTGSQEFPLEI